MIDALLATLERDADAAVARVLQDARAAADAIMAESERRIAARRAQTLGRRETTARAQLERALAGARQKARETVLNARAALLERVFAVLRVTLPAVAASPAYLAGLPGELARIAACIGEQAATIHCAGALAPALRRLITSNGHVRIRVDTSISAGFRTVTEDGTLEVDATLASRLERLRPRLALDALAALS